MKTNERMVRVAFGAMLFAGGCLAMAHFANAADAPASQPAEHEEHEDKLPVDQLPAAVVDGVKAAMPDAKITEAEKEMKHGKTVYELDVQSGGKAYEVKVGEDGKVLGKKIDDDEKDEK